jgi:hypothetical protein
MRPELSAEDWNRLSTQERIKRCLQYAQEAERFGQPAIAKQWRDVANEIAAVGQSARPD